MRFRSLTHLLEVVSGLLHPERITVLGSSALLAEDPDLGEPGQALEFSYDADFLIEPIDVEHAAIVHEAVGQDSLFSKRHGYYADILRPEIIETLPRGWETRLVDVPECRNAHALNRYDLALVKLVIGRTKDLQLLRVLLNKGLLLPEALRAHYQSTALSDDEAAKAGRNLRGLFEEIR